MTMAMPDVCKTPMPPGAPVPIPYPNMAMLAQGTGTAKKVKIMNSPAFHMKSKVPMSSGDEPGVAGGVISGKFKGPCKPKKGSGKVKIEGQPAIFLTCIFGHNGNNANMPAGVHSVPSQVKVICMG